MKAKKCPRCLRDHGGHWAVSRRDDETIICDGCGTDEAMVDFARHYGWRLPMEQEALEKRMADHIEAKRGGQLKKEEPHGHNEE